VDKGFSLIEVLVSVVVVGMAFSIILLTVSNIEQSVINSKEELADYAKADNAFSLYLLDRVHKINYIPDKDSNADDIETDEMDTFFERLNVYSVKLKKDDEPYINIKEYVFIDEK